MEYRFLVFKQLSEDKNKCKSYDGYSANDMLEYFIKNNGYNPFEEYTTLKDILIKEFIDKKVKGFINECSKPDEFNFEAYKELGEYIDLNIQNMQIKNFIISITGEK